MGGEQWRSGEGWDENLDSGDYTTEQLHPNETNRDSQSGKGEPQFADAKVREQSGLE